MNKQLPIFLPCLLAAIFFHHPDCHGQKEFRAYSVRGAMYVSEGYTTRPFSKLLVVTGLFDKKINEKIMLEFEKIGVNAINSLDILPPVKDYREEDLIRIYRMHNIDGVVRSEVKDITISRGVATYEIELSFFDVENDVNAVMFIGRALSTPTAPDKSIHKFFRAVVKELSTIITL